MPLLVIIGEAAPGPPQVQRWRGNSMPKRGVCKALVAVGGDPLGQVDRRHSDHEQRYVGLGETNDGRRPSISFTVRRGRARVISARPMSNLTVPGPGPMIRA
jgi:hypothetical protein